MKPTREPATVAKVLTNLRRAPAADPTEKLGILTRLLGFQLQTAKVLVFDSFESVLAQHDLGPRLFGMLVVVNENSGLNQTELSAILMIDRSQTVRDLDKLEEMKLVRRVRAKYDRRSQIVEVRDRGKNLIAALTEKVRAHEQAVANNLTANEQKSLLSLLQKLIGAAS